jgi:hypothetical protein
MTGVQFQAGAMMGFLLFATASRSALVTAQPPIQWIMGALTTGVKRPRLETDHSQPSRAEIKYKGRFYSTLLMPVFKALYLVKHRDNFTFTLDHFTRLISLDVQLSQLQIHSCRNVSILPRDRPRSYFHWGLLHTHVHMYVYVSYSKMVQIKVVYLKRICYSV